MKRVQRVFGDVDALRYVDGRLDDDRRSAFQAHLAGDQDLSSRVQLWVRQNEALRGAFAGETETVPLWLRLDQLDPERGGPDARSDELRASSARLAPFAPAQAPERGTARPRMVAAAVALVALGGLSMLAARTVLFPALTLADDGPSEDRSAVRAREAYRVFALDPARPVEVGAADQPGLEHWLTRRVGTMIRTPDLRDLGWTLLGGRLTPGEAGPAAFLVYDDGTGQRLGLYVDHASEPARTGAVAAPVPGGSTLSWASGTAAYVVTAEKDEAWMTWNAAALKAKIDAGPTP